MKFIDRIKKAISILFWGDEYRRNWEIIGLKKEKAFQMMDNSKTEEEIQKSGKEVAERLRKALNIDKEKRVLEIGCGVGRIGKFLAENCKEWVGVDISKNLLKIAKKRLKNLSNIKLKYIKNANLSIFEDNCFDVVYSHIVFLHLEKEDMWNYILEAKRVLKPYGIFYFDTFNLTDEWGFKRFLWEVDIYKDKDKPIHRGHWSTPEEIKIYIEKAELKILEIFDCSYLIQAFTTKTDPSFDERKLIELKNSLKYAKEIIPLGDAKWWED